MTTENIKISFEFFPPKTPEGREKLKTVRAELNKLGPDYFSCTYGAGGSTRDNTKGVVLEMREEGYDIAPHLSFGADSEETIHALLSDYKNAGVNRLVALRGDLPSGMGAPSVVYASELVAFARKHFGDHFKIAVACYPETHPQAPSYSKDIEYLKQKFDAGANTGITQYFYHADAYFYFAEECDKAGIHQPIYPGIMPITNYQNLVRFSDACGADIPRWIRKGLENCGEDKEAIRAFGLDVVTSLCEQLIDGGIPGFHFYTMNQVEPTRQIIENLGLIE
ncbi:methylenetetrahydrofolate reductase [NAD(P)H] [bacterium SCSIO 12696]|nr:methylenetetrahydrofolate reductase [NAD(P)H] [bacterium SCSIO 12696]